MGNTGNTILLAMRFRRKVYKLGFYKLPMGKFAPKKDVIHGVDEVKFKNHLSEFQRFYSNHKSFCDEVTGLKPRSIIEDNQTREFYITKENFIFAIRKLMSFVIDNLHYIKSVADIRAIEKSCYDLEDEFLNDTKYQKLAKKTRTPSEEVILTKRYLEYIMRIYDIGNRLVNLLQSSIMIATSHVAKEIEYHNETNFFDELSRYRTEISDSISNYRFSDTLIQLKKILGYHYTYKILIAQEEQEFTEKILQMLIREILQEKNIKLIQKVAERQHLRDEEKADMMKTHTLIKRALLKVYYITNKNLSERKILPKIQRKVHVDKTLI